MEEEFDGVWSVAPGAVDRNSFVKPYDDDDEDEDEDDFSFAKRTATSPRAGRSTKTSLSMSRDETDQALPGATMLEDIDLEALAATLPLPSSESSRCFKGSWATRFLCERRRTNPTSKSKLKFAASILLVASCLIAITVTLSSSKKSKKLQTRSGHSVGAPVLVEADPTILLSTSNHSVSPSSKPPTVSTSYFRTFEPSLHPTTFIPTVNPTTDPQTAAPSFRRRRSIPTHYPSSFVTYSPTMNCADTDGEWMTYNDKLRDCVWLDDGHNGAASAIKDMNCLSSELGEKCRFACRLYNGCMEFLLSAISDYTENNDISIGESCADKEGLFLSHEGIPKNCTWINEDPNTAPMKRNLNCGTTDNERTELGVMCPATCAGYNQCKLSESGDIVTMSSAQTEENLVDEKDDDKDTNDGLTFRIGVDCKDEDGYWMNHKGNYMQCRWFFTDEFDVVEKKRLNCGVTEIGHRCKEACDCVDDFKEKENGSFEKESLASLSGGETNQNSHAATEPSHAAKQLSHAATQLNFVDSLREKVNEQVRCEDNEEDQWRNHDNKKRWCRWLGIDGEISSEKKKILNCGKTEIGFKCKKTCGCVADSVSLETTTTCEDKIGEWKTHEGNKAVCEWMDGEFAAERRELNCGITEIGLLCQCKCQQQIQDANDMTGVGHFIPLFDSTTPAPVDTTSKYQGRLDDTGKMITLLATEAATVSQSNEKMNNGESVTLFVDSTPGAELQALIIFDLSYAEQSLNTIGSSILRLYARQGSPFGGGVEFRKMFEEGYFREVSEPTIAFLDEVADETWYEIDMTAAVQDAVLHGEGQLGIRIISSESRFSFASKDTDRYQPELVIDLTTKRPTNAPTSPPTHSPTASPVISLDCMDSKGLFVTHTGESQGCSWFEVGNGEQKKELNCKGYSEAAIFCQSQCSAFNGCDSMTCDDKSGSYFSHTGLKERCSFLLTGAGTLKLEQNCGTEKYPTTELGKRCQATCSDYNGCSVVGKGESLRKD